jgi:hypothetical protein
MQAQLAESTHQQRQQQHQQQQQPASTTTAAAGDVSLREQHKQKEISGIYAAPDKAPDKYKQLHDRWAGLPPSGNS